MTTVEEPPAAPGRRALLSLRAYYFFSFGALGALFPYLPLLLADRGFTAQQIGLVMVVSPAAHLLWPPLWGALSDALQGRLLLLRLACLGSALSVLLLLPRSGLGWSLAAMAAYTFFRAPLGTLADAAAFDAMGGARADFSRVRLWGSMGFAAFVVAMGAAGGSTRPALLLGATAAVHLASGLATLPMGSPPFRPRVRVLGELGTILRRPALVLFLLGTATYYAGHASYDAYFGLHARALGEADWFVGLAWAVGVTAEVALMLLAPRFIHRFRSGVLLALASAASVLRWTLLAVVAEPWAVLGSQPLHAVTFGLWYLSMAKHVQARAPEHLRTSLQAVALASMGLGMLVGYLGGGRLFELGGGPLMFGAAAAAALVAGLLYLAAVRASPARP